MKIGILTFHRSYNYGAFMQCFSLVNRLKKDFQNLNFEVGKVLAQNFTTVIVMGVNAQKIKDGVKSVGGKAVFFSNLQSVKTYLSKELNKGDLVVFFSDLPDKYGG